MSIICSICGKKQSGWIQDFPLKENGEDRICAICYENLSKLVITEEQDVFDAEKKYFENAIGEAPSIKPTVKEYIVSVIETKINNSLKDVSEVFTRIEAEKLENKKNRLEKQVNEMLLTTGYNFDGYKILKQIDVIFEEKIIGIGLKTSLKSIGDIFSSLTGDEMYAITDRIKELKNAVKKQLKYQAAELGANAIIGIDFETTFPGGSCIMVSINGTAVFVENSFNNAL